MGPLAIERQRDRVEGYIAKGVAEGATLATGGGRPKDLDPRLVHRADGLRQRRQLARRSPRRRSSGRCSASSPPTTSSTRSRIANDTIYGLNASVFTNDVDRAREVARQLRSGTVGHNAFRTDFGIAFGGFKQSGIGREGGTEGLLPFLETKTVILNGEPSGAS